MIEEGIPPRSRRRYAAGRKIKVPKKIRTVRDLLRRHLREEGMDIQELAPWWNVQPNTVKGIMWHGRPLSPQYIDAVIEALKLDEFDANELRVLGAIESGWNINVTLMKDGR